MSETSCNTRILRGETVRCEEVVTILEILRLTEAGHSQRKIAASVGCSKSTVGEIQRRCRKIGLSYGQASAMTNDEIKSLVYPVYSGKKTIKPVFGNRKVDRIGTRKVDHLRYNPGGYPLPPRG